MKRFIILSALTLLAASFQTFASEHSHAALKMIPGGKIIQEEAREVTVLTPNQTAIEVEFKRNGKFEEASGDNLEKDIFAPEGLLSLQEAVALLKKEGKNPIGDWSLEESLFGNFYYEFEGIEAGKEMDYQVDAKTGKITAEIDD